MTNNTDPVRAHKPCGGCGNADPEKVCVGCLHDFGGTLASAPPSAPVGVDLPINDAVPAPTETRPGNLFLWNWTAMQQYGRACIAHALSQQPAAPDFCDGHCTWLDHVPGCPRHEGQQPAAPSGEAVEATGGDLLPCPWCKDKRVHDYFDDRGCIAYVTCMNHFPRDAKCGRTVTVSISPQHNTPAKAKAEARRRWNEQALYASAQQPAGVDEAMVERIAAMLHEEATGEPWTVAGVEHPGPDRDYYRGLARKVAALAGQQPAGVDEAVAVVHSAGVAVGLGVVEWNDKPLPEGTKLYTAPQQPAGVDGDEVRRVAQHIGTAADYIDKAYPDANMLDRGPILRNMRRWHERLTAALAAQQQGGAE